MKNNLKNIVIGVLVITIVGLIIVNKKDTSIYQVPVKSSEIKEYNDNNIVAMNIQDSNNLNNYNESTNMPDPTKYVINSSKSYCTKGIQGEKDTNVEMKTISGNHVFNNLAKNDRCFLYFDLAPLTVPDILAKYTKDNSRSGEITAPFTSYTPTTVYSVADDDGTSYMFAGFNPNNWVKIGNLYFRIIRFNGDGTMRLIYSGSGSARTSGTGTQISKSAFNTNRDDNAYVGFMYGNTGSSTYAATHANTNSSTIKGVLDTWYTNNLTSYASIIDTNAGFCGDRKVSTSRSGYGTLGYGTNQTAYGAVDRYQDASFNALTSYTPSLKCSQSADLYTKKGASKGNKALTNPIGLITVDEYALAGGGSASGSSYYNTTFWLHTGQTYWTMSPHGYNGAAFVFGVISNGYLSYSYRADNVDGVRPVINLKSSTTFTTGGTGTSSNPYVLNVN